MTEEILEVKDVNVAKKKFSLGQHAASGAIFAALIGAVWVAQYLVATRFGVGFISGNQILDYVMGQAFNLETSPEALFVVMTRFILAFGFSWAPITLVITILDYYFGAK